MFHFKKQDIYRHIDLPGVGHAMPVQSNFSDRKLGSLISTLLVYPCSNSLALLTSAQLITRILTISHRVWERSKSDIDDQSFIKPSIHTAEIQLRYHTRYRSVLEDQGTLLVGFPLAKRHIGRGPGGGFKYLDFILSGEVVSGVKCKRSQAAQRSFRDIMEQYG